MTFTRQEIETRWERARRLMRERQLDALLVGDKYNYWYFTGHLSREFDKKMRPMLMLIPQAAPPTLIVYRQAARALQKTCPSACLASYEDVPFPPQLLVETLQRQELQSARVGMEFGENERLGMAYHHFLFLKKQLPDCRFADAGPLLLELRLLKAAAEIERVREACRISLEAWQESLPQFRPGMTNADIKQILAAELCRAGSDFDVAGHVTVGNGVAGEQGYRPGEVVWCDFGASFGGYQADLARRAVFRPVSPEQAAVHRQISAILETQIRAIAPGRKASDIARVVSQALGQHGYPPLGPRKRVGHGLGLAPAEPPSLSLSDDTVLEPGMILTPEPRFYLDSGEKVHLEEVVLVTDQGCRQLTRGAEILREIG